MTADTDNPPVYLGSPVLDALAQVACELTAELWTVKRRLRLLEDEVISLGGRPLDQVIISDEEASASAQDARAFVDSVLRAFDAVESRAGIA